MIWGEGVAKSKETKFLKTVISSLLKFGKTRISRVDNLRATREPTREMCKCIGSVSRVRSRLRSTHG